MARDNATPKADERSAVRGAAKAEQEHDQRTAGKHGESRPQEEPQAEEKAAQEATELAGEERAEQVLDGDPAVDLAGEGRVAADQRAEVAATDERRMLGDKTTEGDERGPSREDGWHVGKQFTTLHAMLRSGRPVKVGKPVSFDEDEGEHVAYLLAQKAIIEGAPEEEHVRQALGEADLARGRSLAVSGF